ncbi:MAG: DUF6268 family outer membrane beta-barrel protein [Tannerella sp.]|jgi:hypothetical protein|nr:DUF6268 family outer membrane beta-barrel protein [Tannerella sp.]
MKVLYCTIILSFFFSASSFAQGYIKTDYLFPSSLKNENGDTFGKGDLLKISGRYILPLSVRQNSLGQISAWSATLSGSYGIFGNKKITEQTIPDEIINLNLSISHIRPISQKWYMVASLGGGIYAEPDAITAKSILINGGIFFVYKLLDNLDVGIGAGITNSYGVPVLMPTSYIKWNLTGKYKVTANITNSMEISASAQFNDKFSLKLVGMEMDGMSAVMNIEDKSMIYSSTIMKSYLVPEYKIGKSSTLYLGAGGAWMRSSKLSRRTLKGFWNTFKSDDNNPDFKSTGYLTVGFRYRF